jgi:HEAT repeat protein
VPGYPTYNSCRKIVSFPCGRQKKRGVVKMSKETFYKALVAVVGVFLLALVAAWILLGKPSATTREGSDADRSERILAERETKRRLDLLEKKLWAIAAPNRPAEGLEHQSGSQGEGMASAEAALLRTDFEGLRERAQAMEAAILRIEEQLAQWGDPRLAAEATKKRREEVKSLAKSARRDAPTLDALYALLADPDPAVREEALRALRDPPATEAIPRIRELLADPDPRVRREAIKSLRELGAADSADVLAGLLGDADDKVREEAAGALGDLNARGAAAALSRVMEDPSPGVRREAMFALARLGDQAALDWIASFYEEGAGNESLRAARILKENGRGDAYQEEVRRLAEVARSGPDEKTRAEAVKSLVRHARDDAQDVFKQALEDPSPRVRNEAKKALSGDAAR